MAKVADLDEAIITLTMPAANATCKNLGLFTSEKIFKIIVSKFITIGIPHIFI